MTVRSWALVCALAVFWAWESAPALAAPAESAERALLEKAANVESGGMTLYAPTSFATAHGGRMEVDFVAGVFAQSAGRIHLLSYDRVSKSFRQDLSFETAAIPGVALVTGSLGRKQLQIRTESGLVACTFGKLLKSGKVADQIYERLIASGVHTFESPGWVDAITTPGPTIITIYIAH
jgi:hypothetical protein